MSSLATCRHRWSRIAAKSSRRLAGVIWTGKPITRVKSHSSSSKTGRLAPGGSASLASRQMSAPANGEACAPEPRAVLARGFMR
jgi:hypothetical protein